MGFDSQQLSPPTFMQQICLHFQGFINSEFYLSNDFQNNFLNSTRLPKNSPKIEETEESQKL